MGSGIGIETYALIGILDEYNIGIPDINTRNQN
jgi:hypothetical protein